MRNKMTIAQRMNKVTAVAMTFALAIGFLFPAKAYSVGASFLIDVAAAKQANSGNLPPQCSSQPVVAAGLRTPIKLIFTEHGNLLVAEMGFGPNSGRISIVDPGTGNRRTFLDGLPSGFILPTNITSGPSGLAMRGRTLYVAIGGGDSTLPGASVTTRVPNPNPSSPLFSSVLAVHFSAHVEQATGGFTLTYADQLALQNGSEVKLDNGGGDKLGVRLVTNFPDYVAEPRADEQHNVRPADPFGIVIAADQLYIADTDSNAIRVVDIHTGEATTLKTFAPLAFGKSEIEAVPAGLRFFGDQMLVTFLTVCKECAAAPPGMAEVRLFDPVTASDESFITGLSAAIDVLPMRGQKGHRRTSEFLTLEFSADVQLALPGILSRYSSPDAAPIVIADCLNAPTSMARDERTGDLFITEMFTGRIVKVAAAQN